MKKVILSLVCAFCAVLYLTGCTLSSMFSSGARITGSGKVITETRQVNDLSGVELAAIGKLIITQGEKEELTITGDDNIVALIKTEVRAGKLVIEFERSGLNISPLSSITYNLTVVNLTSMQITGAGEITSSEFKTENLAVGVSGAGTIEVGGEATAQVVTISGAGNYSAADLKSQSVRVTITGAGNATVWAQKTLDATISGLGKVSYYGSPSVTKKITGAGSVEAKGDK